MHAKNRILTLLGKCLKPGFKGHSSRRAKGESGSALVEFAMVLPMFLLLATGMFTFGITLNQYLELTNAIGIGAEQLAVSRGAAVASDPCALATAAVYKAAPMLSQGAMAFTFAFTPAGSTTAAYTHAGDTCTAGAAYMQQGESVLVFGTYPCTLSVYGVNFVPGCTLHAYVSEIIQ